MKKIKLQEFTQHSKGFYHDSVL